MNELDEQMIELTIEALTGTVYDLCVSPFETILGIKMKIQRLEGIPVYQQQLVHDSTELQDELCLEEYGIGSGAQLKLLLAMRGGPIHAHRVQLEDPTLLEIAEVLEATDCDHKYTIMLLRDGDSLEMADFVQVVADDSPGHVSPLPQATATEQETTSIALSKVTRGKMEELMERLKMRSYRKHHSQQTTATATTTASEKHSGSQLHRRGTAKLLILDSRSSSRLLRSSAPSPLTPHSTATPGTSKTPTAAQRKLVFPAGDSRGHTTDGSHVGSSEEECTISHRHHTTGLLEGIAGQRSQVHPPQQQTERHQSLASYTYPHQQTERQHRQWRRRRRLRRPSCLQEKPPPTHYKAPPTVENTHKDMSELAEDLSQLALKEEEEEGWGRRERGRASRDRLTLPRLPAACSKPTTQPLHRLSSGVPQLPAIAVGHVPSLMGRGHGKGRPHCMRCGKKTGLASTYTCRCGGVFCSLHRYAESHDCSFDYKTQGREAIARGNPLVVAPKLPKI